MPNYWFDALEPFAALEQLRQTPVVVPALLQDLPEVVLNQPVDGGGWAIRNTVGLTRRLTIRTSDSCGQANSASALVDAVAAIVYTLLDLPLGPKSHNPQDWKSLPQTEQSSERLEFTG
jgi:hypothetical protein